MRELLGFDARELTPGVVRKIVKLAAETRSHKRAAIALSEADVFTSAKTVERVVLDVGGELTERRDAPQSSSPLANRPENVPALAVVECDGGRIRTRQPGNGPGVTLEGKGWNETKNACLIRADHKTFDEIQSPIRRPVSWNRSMWRRSPRPKPCRWRPRFPKTKRSPIKRIPTRR